MNLLEGKPKLAANYGWFREDGAPIQPLSTHHDIHCVDYSEVVRLVRRDVVVDGVVRDIEEVGRDAELAGLVSVEGPLRVWRLPVVPKEELPAPPHVGGVDDPASWRAELKIGMKGPDVGAWQRVLMRDGHNLAPLNDDERFGKVTHRETASWQIHRGLPGTGVVDAASRAVVRR